jgi:hypothetical protein
MRIREEVFSGTVFDHFADKGAVSRRLIEALFFLISWALSLLLFIRPESLQSLILKLRGPASIGH